MNPDSRCDAPAITCGYAAAPPSPLLWGDGATAWGQGETSLPFSSSPLLGSPFAIGGSIWSPGGTLSPLLGLPERAKGPFDKGPFDAGSNRSYQTDSTCPSQTVDPLLATPARQAAHAHLNYPRMEARPEPARGEEEPDGDTAQSQAVGAQVGLQAIFDAATTIMVRNLPSKINGDDLVAALKHLGFEGKFDLAFLAVDRVSKSCKGYGFINFDAPQTAAAFCVAGQGYPFPRGGPARARRTEVSIAYTQGVYDTLERLATSTSKKKVKQSFCEQMFVHFRSQGGELESMTAYRALTMFRESRGRDTTHA